MKAVNRPWAPSSWTWSSGYGKKLEGNPFLNSRRHPRPKVRWRLTERFPYRVIYEIDETRQMIVVAAVLHGARSDRLWKRRFKKDQPHAGE